MILLALIVILVLSDLDNIRLDAMELSLITLCVVTPILNIMALARSSACSKGKWGDSWISLWFKRKALEEKKKIEDLSDN
jgi:hypothetical protein